jgi:hypothetical protein
MYNTMLFMIDYVCVLEWLAMLSEFCILQVLLSLGSF